MLTGLSALPRAVYAQNSGAGGEAIRQPVEGLLRTLGTIWNARIATLGGNPVTVSTVVLAGLAVIVGFWVSRWISKTVTSVVERRFRLEPGAASAIRTLSFYVLFVVVVVSALDLVNFPLTAFTIAGGALAIGVGFGSQNIMNNFISGLILHVERPVRVNDVVEVEGTHGTIEHIGARSTRIRALNNTDMIVPNSFFLENRVVNFTLTDDIFRAKVSVGVVYGSPTREVETLMLQAVKEHPKVWLEREPRLLFTEFGDNALIFDAIFWLRAKTIIETRIVESDIRYRIDDLFREAGIVIAFPQRDVHLDSNRPLEIKVVGGEENGLSQA